MDDKVFEYFCISKPDKKLTLNECEFIEIVRYLPKYNKTMPGAGFVIHKQELIRTCGSQRNWEIDGIKFNPDMPDYTFPMTNRICEYWALPGHDYKQEVLIAALNNKIEVPLPEFVKDGEG